MLKQDGTLENIQLVEKYKKSEYKIYADIIKSSML